MPNAASPAVNSPDIIAEPRSFISERGSPTFESAWQKPCTSCSVPSLVYHWACAMKRE